MSRTKPMQEQKKSRQQTAPDDAIHNFLKTMQENEPKHTKNWQDKELAKKVAEYDKAYFGDMRFEKGSVAGGILLDANNNAYKKKESDEFWADPFNISLNKYTFRVRHIKDESTAAEVNAKTKVVTIDPREAEDMNVILHEMIHAYEWELDLISLLPFWETLLVRLYDSLKGKTKNLDNLIMAYADYENQYVFTTNHYGIHGILFFLKSLDLDLRLGWPIGTVMGYGISKDNLRVT